MTSSLSLEWLPLTGSPGKLKTGYGSIFTYYTLLRSGSLNSKTLQRSDSMVSLCYRTLLTFIVDDNLSGLQNFLENKRVVVDDRDESGSTALHYATSKNKLSFVRELINHGADVNAEDNDNWTALLCAAKEGFTDICIELLDHGAHIEHRDMGGWSSLMWAAYKGHTQTVSVFLERNADVNAHGNFHISSLLWASGRGHVEIVKMLVKRGVKVNVGDKYGTSALVWACRKGNVEIVDCLLKAGANVDSAGMYSWTPLLVAAMGNHVEVVSLLLEYKPNINALDKDGCTALTIACKEGYHEIAISLLNVGAYINIQDRSGDTNLIHAVKGGHRSIVEALIKKYADVDIPGKERKTATYTAIEKGNIPIVKLLLSANADMEISTKDGDTCLLRAVRSRNVDAVQLLLEKKAKVNACDKRGDTALHIAMRARSKAIVEVLLRNPKNSQLLYRPNRSGETPYNIDMNHQKTILGQIFGARRLNTNEDNENLLGYDLYSSALADILSEPSLSMPITVGLYAKWGSGKSFLLNKLREEMKNFARQWIDPTFQFSWLLLALVSHLALIVGVTAGLVMRDWLIGVGSIIFIIILTYVSLLSIWYGSQRYDWDWPYSLNVYLTKKMNSIRVVLQVIFCHPSGSQWGDSITAQPIRFYFTDQTRVSSTAAGENSVVQMIGSLYDSIENDYGALCTRLYRAFRPKSLKSTSSWRWRRLCCVPNIISFELCFLCTIIGSTILTVYMMELKISGNDIILERITGQVILIICAVIVGIFVISNLYSISRLVQALVFSQRRHLRRAISRLDTLKSEGFLQALRSEVNLMTEMVKCLDSFTQQQTRLVIIVDGLDSCEQDKVLLVLDAVHVLFSDANTPFIIILAIDPHVISKAVEVNSRRLLSESNIGGHDYLRNMVHLPFYLQNSGLRKVKVAQKSSQSHRKSIGNPYDNQQESTLVRSASSRRLSTESGGLSSQEKLKLSVPGTGRKGSRKLKLSESIASSLGSNLNRVGGAHELTKMLLTDDYFSDVNPRSMRRLMNVVYVTGRLLKAFQMDFNWYHLASWINITEQWPYRTSWLILSHDASEDQLDDNTSLKSLYDKIRPQIPTSKDAEPLLELDRDERKFDIFLTFHRSSLLVSDMRVFLPFTINLDPYIKKVIKEDQQNVEETMVLLNHNNPNFSPWTPVHTPASSDPYQSLRKSALTRRHRTLNRTPSVQTPPPLYSSSNWSPHWMPEFQGQIASPRPFIPVSVATPLPVDVLETRLSNLSVDGVCQLLGKIDEMQGAEVSKYVQVMQSNNINGRVLLHCDLDELKKVVQMNFGDWELFRMVIVSLREHEVMSITQQEETSNNRNVRFASQSSNQHERRLSNVKNPSTQAPPPEKDRDRVMAKQSVMEKQVTLEEQMICGALQTLNEEACEDVLDEEQNALQVPDSGDISRIGNRIRTTSQSSYTSLAELCETDVLILQSSPIHPPYWSPRDSQSAASSITNTPILSRKRRDSKTTADSKSNLKSQPNSRPVSLLVALPSEEDIPSANSSLTIPLPAEEFKNQATKISSSSLINNITSTLLGNRKTTINGTPSVTITPATSVEALSRMNTYQENVGSLSSDDESTPLVSEMSTPSDPTPAGVEFSNQGFGSPVSSEVSPTSIKSTAIHEIPMGAESSFRTLEGADAQYSLYVFGQDREYSSRFSHSICRQDAIDSENDENYSTQDDPETTV